MERVEVCVAPEFCEKQRYVDNLALFFQEVGSSLSSFFCQARVGEMRGSHKICYLLFNLYMVEPTPCPSS